MAHGPSRVSLPASDPEARPMKKRPRRESCLGMTSKMPLQSAETMTTMRTTTRACSKRDNVELCAARLASNTVRPR